MPPQQQTTKQTPTTQPQIQIQQPEVIISPQQQTTQQTPTTQTPPVAQAPITQPQEPQEQ